MQRRILVSLAAAAAASAVTGVALAQDRGRDNDQQQAGGDLGAALRRYLALPGTKSYLVHAGPGGSLGQISHRPERFLFTASAYKTFVLGQYLRDVEAGRLSEDEQVVIDDSVRMFSSPVFLELAGSDAGALGVGRDDRLQRQHRDRSRHRKSWRRPGARAYRRGRPRLDSHSELHAPLLLLQLGAPAGVDFGWPGIADTAGRKAYPAPCASRSMT